MQVLLAPAATALLVATVLDSRSVSAASRRGSCPAQAVCTRPWPICARLEPRSVGHCLLKQKFEFQAKDFQIFARAARAMERQRNLEGEAIFFLDTSK